MLLTSRRRIRRAYVEVRFGVCWCAVLQIKHAAGRRLRGYSDSTDDTHGHGQCASDPGPQRPETGPDSAACGASNDAQGGFSSLSRRLTLEDIKTGRNLPTWERLLVSCLLVPPRLTSDTPRMAFPGRLFFRGFFSSAVDALMISPSLRTFTTNSFCQMLRRSSLNVASPFILPFSAR